MKFFVFLNAAKEFGTKIILQSWENISQTISRIISRVSYTKSAPISTSKQFPKENIEETQEDSPPEENSRTAMSSKKEKPLISAKSPLLPEDITQIEESEKVKKWVTQFFVPYLGHRIKWTRVWKSQERKRRRKNQKIRREL